MALAPCGARSRSRGKGTALSRRMITGKLAALLTIVVVMSACSAPEEVERAKIATPAGPSPTATSSSADADSTTAPGVPAARTDAMMADAPGNVGVLLFGGWKISEAVRLGLAESDAPDDLLAHARFLSPDPF